MAWRDKFNVIGIVPGKVVTKKHGEIDFSRADVPEELCETLVKEGFPYLERIPAKKVSTPAAASDEKAAK